MIQSEVMLHYKDIYAGTADIVTGIDKIETKLEFDEETHTYTLEGKVLPSVTTLLNDGSYNNVDPEILKKACDRGTTIHKEIELYLKNGLNGTTREFNEFLDIFTQYKELFQEKAIFDIKTYSQATPNNRKKCLNQEKMYAKAILELTGECITKFYMIHLPKNGRGKLIRLGE